MVLLDVENGIWWWADGRIVEGEERPSGANCDRRHSTSHTIERMEDRTDGHARRVEYQCLYESIVPNAQSVRGGFLLFMMRLCEMVPDRLSPWPAFEGFFCRAKTDVTDVLSGTRYTRDDLSGTRCMTYVPGRRHCPSKTPLRFLVPQRAFTITGIERSHSWNNSGRIHRSEKSYRDPFCAPTKAQGCNRQDLPCVWYACMLRWGSAPSTQIVGHGIKI